MDGPEGSVHRTNLRVPDIGMILAYTFAGSKDFVSYYPHCTFFGYRYVSITATDEVRIRSIASIPVTSIAQELETRGGTIGLDTRFKLMKKAFAHTAEYDTAISKFFTSRTWEEVDKTYGQH